MPIIRSLRLRSAESWPAGSRADIIGGQSFNVRCRLDLFVSWQAVWPLNNVGPWQLSLW